MANDFYDDDAEDRHEPLKNTSMIQIEPFDAEDMDGEKLRVVGIAADATDDTFDFIVIKTLENDEMIPVRACSVWPVSPPKADEAEKRKPSLHIV